MASNVGSAGSIASARRGHGVTATVVPPVGASPIAAPVPTTSTPGTSAAHAQGPGGPPVGKFSSYPVELLSIGRFLAQIRARVACMLRHASCRAKGQVGVTNGYSCQ